MYDVTAIGELLIDFAARDTDAAGYSTMKANPGGAPGNFLAALSKYGLRTAFLGKVAVFMPLMIKGKVFGMQSPHPTGGHFRLLTNGNL